MLKKFIFFFIISTLFLIQNPSQAQEKIALSIYGDANYPPYSFYQDGRMQGLYTEIIQAIANEMSDFDIKIEPLPWKRGLKQLEEGSIFALYPPYYRPKERPFIYAYSLPLFQEEIVLYCSQTTLDSHKNLKDWPEDYKGLVISNQLGFLTPYNNPKAKVLIESGQIKIKEYKTIEDNLLALDKEANCHINDKLAIIDALNSKKPHIKNVFKNLKYTCTAAFESGHLAITKQNSKTFYFRDDFLKIFNKKLSELKNKPQWQEILNKYLTIEE
ncbi:MAG: substrate-binding periplasmic protein [Gammaproteobacteria bacterium]